MNRLASLLLILTACGGGKNDADPRLIAGGGIGDGEISGVLNVYVIDEDTDEPIAGAVVSVGEPEAEPLTGTTDSSGLYRFEDDSLGGGQTITVTADGYAPATWFGANGANVTITLSGSGTPDVPQAVLTGGITGWDAMDPDPGHFFLALVLYSQTTQLGDAVNEIDQGGITGQLPPNSCTRPALGNCNWTLKSRAGEVAIYALLIDIDDNGTAADMTDDIWS